MCTQIDTEIIDFMVFWMLKWSLVQVQVFDKIPSTTAETAFEMSYRGVVQCRKYCACGKIDLGQ
jgi:hypothetical protein